MAHTGAGAMGMVRTGTDPATNIGAITDAVTLTGVASRPAHLTTGGHWFTTLALWRRNPQPQKTALWCHAAAMERFRDRKATPRAAPASQLLNAALRLAAPTTITKQLKEDQRPAAGERIKTSVALLDPLILRPKAVCVRTRGVQALPAPAALEPTVPARVHPAAAPCPVLVPPAHPALRVPAAAAAAAAAAVPVPAALPQADAVDRARDRNRCIRTFGQTGEGYVFEIFQKYAGLPWNFRCR